MSIRAPFQGSKSEIVAVDLERALQLADDIPATLRHFPGVRGIDQISPGVYHWKLGRLGPPAYKLPISFATRFKVDRAAGIIAFEPVPDVGNASIGGKILIRQLRPGTTEISVSVKGELRVPLSRLFSPVVQAVVSREFGGIVERTTANLKKAFL